MSRFFRQAGDSDSDSSESEDELMSSEGEAPQRPTTTTKTAMSRFLLNAESGSSSSESDEESESESDGDEQGDEEESDEDRPQVRILSAVDRRLKEMEATGVVIENALKINDWVAISNGSCLEQNFYLSLKYSHRIRQALSYDPKATQYF
jgi:translation initiation factor 3 subunit C